MKVCETVQNIQKNISAVLRSRVLKILYPVFSFLHCYFNADCIYTVAADIPTVLDYSEKSKLKRGGRGKAYG